ncbi:MAG: FG-GAP repeat protein [Polyangiaceae bacterium]
MRLWLLSLMLLPGCARDAGAPEATGTAGKGAAQPATSSAMAEPQWYQAKFSEPCGRALLALERTGEPPLEVQVVGEKNPITELRYPVLLGTKLRVSGYLTGEQHDDDHCGSYPVFHVIAYEPAGRVTRLVSVHSIDPQFQQYTFGFPRDKFVPQDFAKFQGEIRLIAGDSCKPRKFGCEQALFAVNDADGSKLCCSLVQTPQEIARTHLKGRQFEVTKASEQHDFRIALDSDCDDSAFIPGECARKGSVSVLKKGTSEVLQRLEQSEIWMQFEDSGELMLNSAELYEYQGTINVGDFNFDGREDFAVQADQSGAYGGPTFAVYLYRASTKRFVHSKVMSRFTQENLGFFDVDPARKQITTFSKSGCCTHWSHTYEMRGERPMLVGRWYQELADNAGWIDTEQRLVKGRWVTSIKTRPEEPSDFEE